MFPEFLWSPSRAVLCTWFLNGLTAQVFLPQSYHTLPKGRLPGWTPGALWLPVCWLGEWFPRRPFHFGSIWKGWMCREGLKEEPCLEARALPDNRKRMEGRLNREAGQGVGLFCCEKGGVSGNSPPQCSKHGHPTCTPCQRPPRAPCSEDLYPILPPGRGQSRGRCCPWRGYELAQKVKRQV